MSVIVIARSVSRQPQGSRRLTCCSVSEIQPQLTSPSGWHCGQLRITRRAARLFLHAPRRAAFELSRSFSQCIGVIPPRSRCARLGRRSVVGLHVSSPSAMSARHHRSFGRWTNSAGRRV